MGDSLSSQNKLGGSYMNPGKTSQYGGVMGTLSNWAGGVGNSLTGQLPVQKQWAAQAQSNGMPQPSAAVDQTGSTPSVIPTSQPPLQLGGGVPVEEIMLNNALKRKAIKNAVQVDTPYKPMTIEQNYIQSLIG
jgi:hypothetical protein